MLVLSVVWVLVGLGLCAWQTFRTMKGAAAEIEHGGGVAAVSAGLLEFAMIFVGPPPLFALLWFILRRPLRG